MKIIIAARRSRSPQQHLIIAKEMAALVLLFHGNGWLMTGDWLSSPGWPHKLARETERGRYRYFDHETGPARGTRLVKRVICLPGETVEIRDNHVHIDGTRAFLSRICGRRWSPMIIILEVPRRLLPGCWETTELLRRRILPGRIPMRAGEEEDSKSSLPLLSQDLEKLNTFRITWPSSYWRSIYVIEQHC